MFMVLQHVSQAGIIQSVEMSNFVCHKNLRFNLGPKANFIVGHNGSGKSAILAAVMVALGGRTFSAGRKRGPQVKSLIRQGQDVAKVTVRIHNQGDRAYRYAEFGDHIAITRTISSSGGSHYSMKHGESGKKVSSSLGDVRDMCEHLGLRVDNPFVILTQDGAKRFLSSSSPKDKYSIFLEGTHLSQLAEEYAICAQNIERMATVIESKTRDLEGLEDSHRTASRRHLEAQKLSQFQEKVARLKRELAWSQVEAVLSDAAYYSGRLSYLDTKLSSIALSIHEASDSISRMETEKKAREDSLDLIDVESLHEKERLLSENERTLRRDLHNLKTTYSELRDKVQLLKGEIGCLSHQEEGAHPRPTSIAEQQDKDLREAESAAQVARATLESAEATLLADAGDKARADSAAKKTCDDEATHQKTLQCARANLQQLSQDSLAVYGNNMQMVLERVERAQWEGRPPLGPLGRYVHLRNPQWAPIMRIHIGKYMCSFVVETVRDQEKLLTILRETKNDRRASVIVNRYDLFDYHTQEPEADSLTVLRALDIDNEHAKRVLINAAKIEWTRLFDSRKDAENALKHHFGEGFTADLFRVSYSAHSATSQPLRDMHATDWRQLLFTGIDGTALADLWRDRVQSAEVALKNVLSLKRANNDVAEAALLKYQESQVAVRDARKRVMLAERHQHELRRVVAHKAQIDPIDTSQNLANLQLDYTAKTEQLQVLDQQLLEVNARVAALASEKAEIERDLSVRYQRRTSEKTELDEISEDLSREKARLRDLKQDLMIEQRQRDSAEKKEAERTEKHRVLFDKATQYCDRVEDPREVKEVKRELNVALAALEQYTARPDQSAEELTVAVNQTARSVTKVKNDLKVLSELTSVRVHLHAFSVAEGADVLHQKLLKSSLERRQTKWDNFRALVAFRCKASFQQQMSRRGFEGELIFAHNTHELRLLVKTDDARSTRNSSSIGRDPSVLSGGEKSFSTICLLLAMWDSIDSPIRFLDEFDVFMDAVNRRKSSEMLVRADITISWMLHLTSCLKIKAAEASEGKQFVIITPQSMDGLIPGPNLQIHRLDDPQRNGTASQLA
ncbi:unnamed protein product [Peniophora sp. CBMAI 1063]|nr:unnamed protein product [Peniophora sp. CBMAI 1063]